MASSRQQIMETLKALDGAAISQTPNKEVGSMRRQTNSVQTFFRSVVWIIIAVPLWMLFARPDFQRAWEGMVSSGSAPVWGPLAFGIIKTIVIFWIANVVARMIYVLPEWERIVLLRMGKSVGARGPGLFIVPPFL
ncbi:MAG: hypothetical protein GQ524_05115, partial [Anaerolineales bacterium]|nr:hypothetical protein [Anaerolineales bacterium]